MKAQAKGKFTNHPALDYLDLEILIVTYVSNNICYPQKYGPHKFKVRKQTKRNTMKI